MSFSICSFRVGAFMYVCMYGGMEGCLREILKIRIMLNLVSIIVKKVI